jgi:hypothetical protein
MSAASKVIDALKQDSSVIVEVLDDSAAARALRTGSNCTRRARQRSNERRIHVRSGARRCGMAKLLVTGDSARGRKSRSRAGD